MVIPYIGEMFWSIGSGLKYKRVPIEKGNYPKDTFKGECLDLEGVGYFWPGLSRGWSLDDQ